MIRYTIERDGLIKTFSDIGGVVLANACGPCIGQWSRHTKDPERKNSIITSFNRNLRNGMMVCGDSRICCVTRNCNRFAIAGKLDFNPITDSLKTKMEKM
ncbi:aconitase family protein [Leptospira noguchii]|nr:aconitase family protein [Leptospira noguchii]